MCLCVKGCVHTGVVHVTVDAGVGEGVRHILHEMVSVEPSVVTQHLVHFCGHVHVQAAQQLWGGGWCLVCGNAPARRVGSLHGMAGMRSWCSKQGESVVVVVIVQTLPGRRH